jgi:ABC-type branched-subunit amino acid transport system substrate-binding protein
MRAGPSRLAGLVVAGALATACGSTVQVSGERSLLGTPVPEGGSVPGTTTGSGTTPGTTSAGADSTLAPTGNGSAAETVPGQVTPSDSGGRPGAGTGLVGPGVTDTQIRVGVYTVNGYDDYAASAGLSGIRTGDQGAISSSVISYINRNGGVLGRKLVPVFHDYSIPLATTNPASETQAACAAWTQDTKVFAVIAPSTTSDMGNLMECLSSQHVFAISELALVDAGFMRRYGKHFYVASGVNETRALKDNVDALFARGFFPPGKPVGVIHYNTTTDKGAAYEGIVPALKAHGLTPDVAEVNIHGSGNEYANIVLRYKAEGVQSVVFTWTSVYLFSQAAQAQRYAPRLGISTYALPQFLQQNVPPSQLKGSMGISWDPSADVDARRDPGPVSARSKLCLKLGAEAGQDETNRSVAGNTLGYCDALLFFADTLNKAKAPTVDAFQEAVRGTGSSYTSAMTFRTRFGPGRNDGAAAYRMLAFQGSCTCFAYDGRIEPMA